MPNWVYSSFTIQGKDKDKVLSIIRKAIEQKSGIFEAFIPMPKSYRDFDTANYTAIGRGHGIPLKVGMKMRCEDDWNKFFVVDEKYKRAFAKAEREQLMVHGVVGWYDWSCAKWGTKWDACNESVDGDVVSFATAWSFPTPFFEKLASEYDIIVDDGEIEEESGYTGDFQIYDRQLSVCF